MEKMGERKRWFFKKINKIDKPFSQIQEKKWIYYDQPDANIFNSLDDVYTFWKKESKLIQVEIDGPNRPVHV